MERIIGEGQEERVAYNSSWRVKGDVITEILFLCQLKARLILWVCGKNLAGYYTKDNIF